MVFVSLIGPPELTAARVVHFAYSTRICRPSTKRAGGVHRSGTVGTTADGDDLLRLPVSGAELTRCPLRDTPTLGPHVLLRGPLRALRPSAIVNNGSSSHYVLPPLGGLLAPIVGRPADVQSQRRRAPPLNRRTSTTRRTSGFRESDVSTETELADPGQDKETLLAQHLLLTYATRRPYSSAPPLPEGTRYDVARGYWIQGDSPLVF